MIAVVAAVALVVSLVPPAASGVGGEEPAGAWPAAAPGPLEPPLACEGMDPDPFDDVNPDSTHGPGIACVAHLGITLGVEPGIYEPGEPVLRDQMATFLARLLDLADPLDLPPPGQVAFLDATDARAQVHLDNAERLAAAGIVSGVEEIGGSPLYGFLLPVSRAAMASFLVGSAEWALASDLAEPDTNPFADVDPDADVHGTNVLKAWNAGLAGGTEPGTYDQWTGLTRAQMATFLTRTASLLGIVEVDQPAEAVSLTAGGGQAPDQALAGGSLTPAVAAQMVDAGGQPVAAEGVTVTLVLRDQSGQPISGAFTGGTTEPTDGDGVAVFDGRGVDPGVAPGVYELAVTAATFGQDSVQLEVVEPEVPAVVSGDGDGEVHALDADGQPLELWAGDGVADTHGGQRISALAFDPDGEVLFTGGASEEVHALDAATGEPLVGWADQGVFDGHDGMVRDLAVAPDGGVLYTAAADETVRALDAATGDPVAGFGDAGVYDGHDDGVAALVVSPDGSTLLTAGSDATVHRLDAATGAPFAGFGDDGVFEGQDVPFFTTIDAAFQISAGYVGAGGITGGGLHAVDLTDGSAAGDFGDDGVYGEAFGEVRAVLASEAEARLFVGFPQVNEVHSVHPLSAVPHAWGDDQDGAASLPGSPNVLAEDADASRVYVGGSGSLPDTSFTGRVAALGVSDGLPDTSFAGDGAYTGHDAEVWSMAVSP